MVIKIAKFSLLALIFVFALIGFFLVASINILYLSVPERFLDYTPLILVNIVGLFLIILSYGGYQLYKLLRH